MHNRASLALGVGIMLLAAWAVISALAWPWKAALFPLAIGLPLFCLAAAEVLWVILRPRARTETKDFQLSDDLPTDVTLRRTALALGWIAGFFAAIVLLGFPVAVPAFMFLYLKLQGKESWAMSTVVTLAVWAVFYGLFDRLLHLPFPDGWILTWLGFA